MGNMLKKEKEKYIKNDDSSWWKLKMVHINLSKKINNAAFQERE